MTDAATGVATTCRDPHDQRAKVLRLVRRAAISSVIATGALVAFAAPSWASSGPATPDSSNSATSSHSADAASTGRSETPSPDLAQRLTAGLADGLSHGFATFGGAHTSEQPDGAAGTPAAADDSSTPATDSSATDSSANDSSATDSSATDQTAPTSSTSSTSSSASDPAATQDDAAPHLATLRAPQTDSPEATPTRTRTGESDNRSHSDVVEPTSTTPTLTSSTTTTPTTPTTTAPAEAPVEGADPVEADPAKGPSILPVKTVTDTVASTLESVPDDATKVVDNTVTTVGSLTTPLDVLSGGATTKLTKGLITPTLTTASTVVDGVLKTAGDQVVDPTAEAVRTAGVVTQNVTDSTGDIVAAVVPTLLGGQSRGNGGSTQPGDPNAPVTGDDPSETSSTTTSEVPGHTIESTGTPAFDQTGVGAPTSLQATSLRGARMPAYALGLGGRLAKQASAGTVGGGSATEATAASDTAGDVAASSSMSDGSDQRVPVSSDQAPTDGGSSSSHSGSSQVGMDLVSSWLPGTARPAVPTADGWRLPGSPSFDPGHSPD